MEHWWKQLRWNATCHAWIAKTDETTIVISEKTYEEHLKTYLASRNIELKTWTQIMQPAETAWQQQCKAVQDFQSNLNYWLTCDDPGVQIHPYAKKT